MLEWALTKGLAVFSEHSLQELYTTLLKSKFQKYARRELVEVFMLRCRMDGRLVAVSESVSACRDPDDDHFLALALAAGAEWILTYDEDLLVLDPFRHREAKINIVRPEHFMQKVQM